LVSLHVEEPVSEEPVSQEEPQTDEWVIHINSKSKAFWGKILLCGKKYKILFSTII
jgi:hypothetical protein